MPDPRQAVSRVGWRGGRKTSPWTSFQPVSSSVSSWWGGGRGEEGGGGGGREGERGEGGGREGGREGGRKERGREGGRKEREKGREVLYQLHSTMLTDFIYSGSSVDGSVHCTYSTLLS